MTVERFLEVLVLVQSVEKESKIQSILEGIASNLSNLASTPGQPAQQSALASGLEQLKTAVAIIVSRFSPADFEAVGSMGGSEYFEPNIEERVRQSVSSNAMTPSVARDFVQTFSASRAEFISSATQARNGLQSLDVVPSSISPGGANVSFLIPRELFLNDIDSFAKEVTFIGRLFGDLSEAVSGERKSAELETLSASVPTVVLLAALPVLTKLADIVNKFLDAWKKVEEIREIRARVAAIGVTGLAYDQFTREITSTVKKVIDESVSSIIAEASNEPGRKNELRNALSRDFKTLFGQIERGLVLRFRAEESDRETPDNDSLSALSQLGKTMQFPSPADAPLLLTNGEVLEDTADNNVESSGDTGEGNLPPKKSVAKKAAKR